jgi:3-methyladenine DNA glycosylase AlkD
MDLPETAEELHRRLDETRAWNAGQLRALRREFSKRVKDADARSVLDLALGLIDGPGTSVGRRFVACELVAQHRPAAAALRTRDVQALGEGIGSWAAVDTFACLISGPAWRERQLSAALIHRWAKSPDRWWRRAALVSTVPLNCKARGGSGDTARTLAVCDLLLHDRDDMVVKAMSWALRELAKRDSAAVKRYLAKQSAELAARAVREVRNKLDTGLKNPRMLK